MTLFVPLIDSRLAQGTAAGQMLYWDATVLRWLATDETKLEWDAGSDLLTADTLTVNTGTINGPNSNVLNIGTTSTVLDFTVDGANRANFQLTNDNGSVGIFALSADATVVEIARAAETDVHLFATATTGMNPEFRIYGFKTGDAVKYGSLMVDTGGDLVISAEEGVIISATGEVDITDIGTLTWGNGTTMAEDPGGITLVPSSTGIFTVTGDLDVSGSVTAAEYFGGSDIHLREDAITFGATNDSASIFLTPSAPGDAWIFCTDNVNVLQLILDSETIILDSAKNTGTPTLITRADDTFFNFKENTRTWLEASWDNRQVIFGEDIFHEQVALPVIFKDKNDGTFVEIDSFAGTIDMKGSITLDPADGGNWAGARVLIGDAVNLTSIDSAGNFTQEGTAITTLDQLYLNEITTPTPIADDGAIYTKSNNTLYFQDGAGNEHLVHGEAFGGLCFHDITAAVVTIAAQDVLTKIDSFDNPGPVDDSSRVTADTDNDELVLNSDAAGMYNISYHISMTATGATREFIIVPGIEFVTPLNIATATNASPIVIGITGHGLKSGSLVTITGCTGNTAANGDWVVTYITDDTFSIKDLNGVASTGNGAYDAGSGDVDIWYPLCLVIHKEVSQIDLDTGGSGSKIALLANDKIGLYVANIDAASDLNVFAVNLNIERSGE